jgi:hypothetical protein
LKQFMLIAGQSLPLAGDLAQVPPNTTVGVNMLRPAHALLLALSIVVLPCAFPAAAQVGAVGQIRGEVRDPTGALIPGAQVTARNLETGVLRQAPSNANGYFVILGVDPGTYEVKCSKEGFKSSVRPQVGVQTQQVSTVDITLTLGQVQENITVAEREELLRTDDANLSSIVDAKRLEEIPLKTRYLAQLTELLPGVAPIRTPQNRFEGSGAGGFVHGLRKNMNSFTLDGANLDDPGFRGDNVQVNGRVGEDSIREFQMLLGTAEANFGHNAGAQINMTTKNGTNDIHGSVFEYFRNEALDARDYFNDTGPKLPFKQNIFGGAVGGPFVKNKHFWFATYEGYYQRRQVTARGTAPTPLLLASVPDGPAVGNLRSVLEAAYPAPDPGFLQTDITAPFTSSLPDVITTNQFTVRTDHQISAKDALFFRVWFLNSVTTAGSSFATLATGTSTFGVDRRQTNVAAGWRRVISPQSVNEFRASVFRPRVVLSARGETKPGLVALGYPTKPDDPGSLGFTVFAGTGLTPIGQLNFLPTGRFNTVYQFNDEYSWAHGRHLFRFGGDFYRAIENDFLNSGRNPFTLFLGFGPPFGFGLPGLTTGLFLLQNQNFYTNPPTSQRHLRSKDFSFFAGDTWKVRPDLTVTLGVRWEYFGVVNEVDGFLNNAFQADASGNPLAESPITDPSMIVLKSVTELPMTKKDLNNFGPRVGFAYHPFSNVVFRAGYGIMYDKPYFNQFINNRFNPPFNISTTLFFSPFGSTADPLVNGLTPNLATVTPDFVAPYVQNYHFEMEWGVMTDTVFRIAYVGNVVRKLTLIEAPNLQGAIPAASRPNPNFLTWEMLTNHAYSNYNGLEVEFRRRLSKGLAFQASYTWSKVLDTRSLADTITTQSEVLPSDKDNLRIDYGPADFNIPHAFKANWYYELPFGRGRRWGSGSSGIGQHVLGGWVVSGRGAIYTNFPFSILSNQDLNGNGSTNNDRAPITVSPGSLVLNQGLQFLHPNLIGTAIVNDPNLPPSGKNILYGPRQNIWDVSVGKTFDVTERVKLDFRALMFNLLNHPNFESPNVERGNNIANPANSSFGRLIATSRNLDNRIIEFSARLKF